MDNNKNQNEENNYGESEEQGVKGGSTEMTKEDQDYEDIDFSDATMDYED